MGDSKDRWYLPVTSPEKKHVEKNIDTLSPHVTIIIFAPVVIAVDCVKYVPGTFISLCLPV